MSILTDENLDAFTITFRREIVFYLRQLVNEATQISVIFDEGRNTLLTLLLDVDEENNQVIFDWGGSEEANRAFLRSERNYFVAHPQGVRNQFATARATATTYNKHQAFTVPIPDKYVRLQRREFFRLNLPITQRAPCDATLPGGLGVKLEATDISLGGVALELPALPGPVDPGQILAETRIKLGTFGTLLVDLEVRHLQPMVRGNRQSIHLGCRFVRLSQAQESEVQRFMSHIQREERSKLGR